MELSDPYTQMSVFLTTAFPTDYHTQISLNLEFFFFFFYSEKYLPVNDLDTVLQKKKIFMKTKHLHPKHVKSFAILEVQFIVKNFNYYVPPSEFC